MTQHKQRKYLLPLLFVSCILTAVMLFELLHIGGSRNTASAIQVPVTDIFEQNLNKRLSTNLGEVVPEIQLRQVYTRQDSNIVAPEPRQDCFGETDNPADMRTVLDAAAALLQGQSTLFTPETPVKEGTTIRYYLDETIFVVVWKQVVDDCTYTFSEIKIAHASQFRRFLSEGRYNSGILHTTTEMSESVNAVMASSGDYYGYRSIGIVVNDGQVYRDRGHYLDTCYINSEGDLIFSYAGDMIDKDVIQQFVDEHHVRFSICFGPVMILDGEYRVPKNYNSGEINNPYARAALCQMDKLHYVVVAANSEMPNYQVPTVAQFGQRLQEMGIPTAYALDGGQTAAIVMNDQLINTVSYGSQREISDIFYFATALPDAD